MSAAILRPARTLKTYRLEFICEGREYIWTGEALYLQEAEAKARRHLYMVDAQFYNPNARLMGYVEH